MMGYVKVILRESLMETLMAGKWERMMRNMKAISSEVIMEN